MAMRCRRYIWFVVWLACSVLLHTQEVKDIDLTVVQQRTRLRHPPAPAPNCEPNGPCVGGGYGGGGVADGAADRRDPHALGVYLLRVNPTDVDPAQNV